MTGAFVAGNARKAFGCRTEDFHPLVYRGCYSGIDIWLCEGCQIDCAAVCAAVLSGMSGSLETTFKDDAQRCVFPLPAALGNAVVKVNRMPRLKDCLRPWRFSAAEFASHCVVQTAGVSCPRLLGAFRCAKHFFASFDGLLVDRLVGYRELETNDCALGAEMVCSLYRSGVNHPDFMRRNVMTNDATGALCLIDLEGCATSGENGLPSLLMMTQRFIEFNELGFEHELSQRFVAEVYGRSGLEGKMDEGSFRGVIEVLLSRHRSRKERRGLILPDEVRGLLPPAVS